MKLHMAAAEEDVLVHMTDLSAVEEEDEWEGMEDEGVDMEVVSNKYLY